MKISNYPSISFPKHMIQNKTLLRLIKAKIENQRKYIKCITSTPILYPSKSRIDDSKEVDIEETL